MLKASCIRVLRAHTARLSLAKVQTHIVKVPGISNTLLQLSRPLSIWSKIKDIIVPNNQPDPVKEAKAGVNKMIDDSTKDLKGVTGFLFRSFLKKVSGKFLEAHQSVLELSDILKTSAEMNIMSDKAVRKAFGNLVEIVMIEDIQAVERMHNGKQEDQQFQATCSIKGSNGMHGSCSLKGKIDAESKSVSFSEIRVYDTRRQLVSHLKWTDENLHTQFNKKKVLTVNAREEN